MCASDDWWFDPCCSALEECRWGFASQAENNQKFKYLPSVSIHNHCQVMWPSALGCNEPVIIWRDGYIYMFWVWSVLSSPEPSWQQCQMQTCTLNHRLWHDWIWSTVAAVKQAHQAVRTGCVFVQGRKNLCGLRSGEIDKSAIIGFKNMTSSGLFTHGEIELDPHGA